MLYIANWDKIPEKTWSGTTLSLFTALNSIVKVNRIDVATANKVQRILYDMKEVILNKSISTDMNFNTIYLNNVNRSLKRRIQAYDSQSFVLQVGDLVNYGNSGIYQDLSIGFLLNVRDEDPEGFKYSGFKDDGILLEKRNRIQKQRYMKSKYIFTMSYCLRDFLVNVEGYSDKKVIHVGGGINLPASSQNRNNKKNKKRILFVGRDFLRKGGDLVIDAFHILSETLLPDAELYIAGPAQLEKKYLIKNVFFLGDLDANKLESYYDLCDIFCMPSRFEAYGLVFAEALSRGLPCIGRNKFDMPFFIEDEVTGYLIDQDDPKGLANKMFMLLKNDQIHRNVINNKKFYQHEYSWETVASRIIRSVYGEKSYS